MRDCERIGASEVKHMEIKSTGDEQQLKYYMCAHVFVFLCLKNKIFSLSIFLREISGSESICITKQVICSF